MNRAAIIIAVKKAGILPELQAVFDGARRMRNWASDHGFLPQSVTCLTDETEPVTAKMIKDAVRAHLKAATCEQLFIYFAGHGVNLRYSEYWLLSGAPDDTQEAVNVASSVQLAKRCGVPHVVFISDACRTAPEGIQAQSITGSEIFPNEAALAPHKAVDVFYASLLGEPALEIKDQGESASLYRSIYTEEFTSALCGKRLSLLVQPKPKGTMYLRSHSLKRHLTMQVPVLVASKLGIFSTHTQTPDADILSDESAFLQDFDPAALPDPRDEETKPSLESLVQPPPLTPAQVTFTMLQDALLASAGEARINLTDSLSTATITGGKAVSAALKRETQSFGPTHFETNCGFKIQGTKIKAIHTGSLFGELVSMEAARVDLGVHSIANVMLELENGRVVVLPAIRNFIAALTFDMEDLVNITYEPSDRSKTLWNQYSKVRDEMAALRAVISTSVHMGVFRLDKDNAPKLTERIRYYKGLDPTLALYAAYSYHRMGRRPLIRDMEKYLFEGLNASLFDVAMLADRKKHKYKAYPFFPMLAQGWSLLGSFGSPTPALHELQPHVAADSLWTVFNESAIPALLEKLNQ